MTKAMSSLLFFSKSKDLSARYLSNFTIIPCGLTIPDDFIVKELVGHVFPSVENAFQAAKYVLAGNLKVALELKNVPPSVSKSMGSKTGMKKNKCILDVSAWTRISYIVMKQLIQERANQDKPFRDTIKNAIENKISLKHFERSGKKSFWGGCFKEGVWYGNNALGNIMENI